MSSNSQPLVTIGIPTYNRPHFLRESLASALNQSYPNIEVVVSDNSENDESQKVVEEIGDSRVRYSRNERNMGAWYNWMRVMELASGDYFGWLQDDDLLMREFVSRGMKAFIKHQTISAYYAYSAWSTSPLVLLNPFLAGPFVPLDWQSGSGTVFSRHLVVPLSLFQSIATFPACLFRKTAVIGIPKNISQWERNFLFIERLFHLEASKHGDFYADAFLGAIFRIHEKQTSQSPSIDAEMLKNHFNFVLFEIGSQKMDMADNLCFFSEILVNYSDKNLHFLLMHALTGWPKELRKHPFCENVLNSLISELKRRKIIYNIRPEWAIFFKDMIRGITPPFLYAIIKKIGAVLGNEINDASISSVKQAV